MYVVLFAVLHSNNPIWQHENAPSHEKNCWLISSALICRPVFSFYQSHALLKSRAVSARRVDRLDNRPINYRMLCRMAMSSDKVVMMKRDKT